MPPLRAPGGGNRPRARRRTRRLRTLRPVQAACHLTDPDGERSRGDPFVVACAQLNGWTVLSGERPRKGPNAQMRIPDACEHLKIPHLDWFTFLREMKWDL